MKSVTVRKLPGHTYTMEMDNGRHLVVMDEDLEDGGEDLGPTPSEMLLSALGGCTAITALMYARRKGWLVEDITVSLTHDKIDPRTSDAFTAEEIENAGPTGKLDLIRMTLLVKGDLDAEQRARLLEIANRCPVHRLIDLRPKITSELIRVE
ncbi:MAG: OsmC family protein [Dehalococcoidia bacterium]